LILLSFLFTIFMINFSSAYFESPGSFVEDLVRGFIDIFEPILRAVLGGSDFSGYFLFEKLLLLVLLIAVIQLSLKNISVFENQKGILRIVSIVVALLAVRYLSFEWINGIILQYQVLAIALFGILPIAIYFFFLHGVFNDSEIMRKIGWVLFIVVYFGLWSTAGGSFGALYFWTMVVSLVFLLFDGSIHRYYIMQEMKRSGATDKWQHIANLRGDIDGIQEDIRFNRMPAKIGNKIIKKKQKQIIQIQKHY
jgi:hypothetical protein